MIKEIDGKKPQLGENCFIAETAVLIGDVRLAAGCNIWYGAVLRADLAPIILGENCNIQDNCVVHVDPQAPVRLGANVTVGHGAIVHSAVVEDNCLIGMGATLLDNCHIGHGSVVGAGALVAQNKELPPLSLAVGVPARVVKELPPESEAERVEHAANYLLVAAAYQEAEK